MQLDVNNEETQVTTKLPCYLANQRIIKDGLLGKNISIRVMFARSRSFLRLLLSFVSSQVCIPSSFFVSFPSFIRPRTQLACSHLLWSSR